MGYFYGILIRELDITSLIKTLPVIPVERENLHMTIVYIGDQRPSQEIDDKIGISVGSIPCFNVKLGQLILLPNALKPRVLAVEVIGNERLSRLRNTIMNILRDSSISINDKHSGEFKPHISIAYIKSKKLNPEDILETAREMGVEEELRDKSLLINSVSLILAKEDNYRELTRHELQCRF